MTTPTILMIELLLLLMTVKAVLIELLLRLLLLLVVMVVLLVLLGGFIHRLLLQNVLGVWLGVAHRALLLLLHAGDRLRQIIQMLFV